MNWEFLIGNNGYFVLLIGTFLEGETILILAGLAAHLGYLYLPWVIVVAFIGTLSGDQLFFTLAAGMAGSFWPGIFFGRAVWVGCKDWWSVTRRY